MTQSKSAVREAGAYAGPSLAIIVRQSPDWATMDAETYKEHSRRFCTMIGRRADEMNELVALWNETLSISFFEMRHAMKEIAEANLAAIERARIFRLDSCGEAFAVDNRICCFVDDDDWFSPTLADALVCEDCLEFDGFRWVHTMIGGNAGGLNLREPSCTVYTNNYAILTHYVNTGGSLEALSQHWIAEPIFKAMRIKDIGARLSISNKHPASTVFLALGLKDRQTTADLAHLIGIYCDKLAAIDAAALPAELAWSRSYLARLQAFARQLPRAIRYSHDATSLSRAAPG